MIPETDEPIEYSRPDTSERVERVNKRKDARAKFNSLMDIAKEKEPKFVEVKQWVKQKKLPFHGIATDKRIQPFAKPPKVIDMTDDVLFEKKWLPLHNAADRDRKNITRAAALKRIMSRKKNANVLDHIREE